MKPKQAEELLATLKRQPLTLEELHEHVRGAGSVWTTDQLQLFLICVSGVAHDASSGVYRIVESSRDGELQEVIVDVVRSFAGRAVPAAEIRKRLPDRFVTTDEQVRAIAKRTSGLEVVGPGLIRIAS